MTHEYIQSVSGRQHTCHMKDIACGAYALAQKNSECIHADRTKTIWLVKKCYVNATHIGTLCAYKGIAQARETRALREITENRIIFHFT